MTLKDSAIAFRNTLYTPPGAIAPIVSDLNFAVPRGQTLALIGESGCGKTTTLRLINGLLLPGSGEVFVEEKSTTKWDLLELRRRAGYVIQEGGLFPHLSAAQNVLLMARHLKKAENETQKRLRDLCELTHFDVKMLARFPAELSGGQRQRVGLMRALMLDPPLLLLDEPLGALDPMVRASLQSDLKEIFARLDKTVILVTHDMAEAAYLSDQIVLMKAGKIVQHGTLDDLRERPADAFVTAFLSAQRSLVQL